MKISVVILNWNRPEDTIKAADSVLAQDHPDFELVIWDNASTDNSHAALESRFGHEPKVRLLFADANYGVAGGRNRAFRETTGDLMFWLDSDAWLEDRRALNLVDKYFAEHPDTGAISCGVKRPDGRVMWPFSRPADEWWSREFDTIRVDGCSFAVRRGVYEKVGGFAEHFSPYGAEDRHFAFKVVGAGHRVVFFPAVYVTHAFAGHGRTSRQFAMHVRNMLLIPLELFPMPHNLLSAAKLAAGLFREALEQRQGTAYFKGLFRAVAGFRSANRHVMSREGWRTFRRLISEDKSLSPSSLKRRTRRALGDAWFYTRVLFVLFPAKAAVHLSAVLLPSKRRKFELAVLALCNHCFKALINPNFYLSIEKRYDTQDIVDFFGISKRMNAGRAWYKGKRLLEIGCGLGKYSIEAAARGAREVCGIDINEEGIRFATAKTQQLGLANVSFQAMSACRLQFEDNAFDGAFSHTVLEHLPDVPAALAEVYRVLKPGAEFIFTFNPFRSRHGAHVNHFIGIPWPCFFFEQETIAIFWTRQRDAFLTSRSASPEMALLQNSVGIAGLNRLRVSELEAMIRNSRFTIAATAAFNDEAFLLRLFPFLKRIPDVYEYLRGSVAFRLLKPCKENAAAGTFLNPET